ncbi:Ig-like domain-containing protein [Paracoccaceae bacterium]|nr:Ig-like domain-containing protein [Paracoccaceae bacterium]
MLNKKIKKFDLEKKFCTGYRQQAELSSVKVAVYKIMPLILVLIASILIPFAPIYAQPTENLEAKYYSTHNRYSTFGNFGGTVIETRTWDKINTRNYNPQGRGDYWSVDIQGYIYIPSNGTYWFQTYSDDGVRLKVDGKTVVNNWTLHGPTYNYGQVNLTTGWKPIQLQMYEWGGGTVLRLNWRPPGQGYYDYPPAANLSTSLPDTTAPTLSGVSIASNNTTSTLAKAGNDITLSFTASEAISTPVVTFQSGGAAITDGSIAYANTSGNTWTSVYTANANDANGPVTYSIAFSDIAANAGTPVTSGSGSVTTDTSVPTLSSVSISSNNANRSMATPTDVVTLSFTASETIQSPTVTASSGGAAVNGNISVSNTSENTWTASFTANANDTAGPVTYSIAFSDTAGNAGTPVTATTDSSNVAVVIDTDLPTLLSSIPSDGSRAVKLDQNIVLKFSESIIAGSGRINLFDGSDKLIEAFSVSPSIISGSTVTLNPGADLTSRSAYYIQIPPTAFVDAAGNGYPGISNKTTLNFITLDVNAPSLISSVPSDNAASVKLDKNIILTFSENITAGSGDIKLFDGNGRLVEAFTVSSSIISGATVTLNPATDLKPDNSYYIQIPSTAFTDAAGNNYAGIINKTEFDFTTRKKTPKEAFTEVKDDIGSDMKANTTKQIRSFATATTAVVTAARGRVLSKRASSSRSRSSNRSSGTTRSAGGGGSGSSSSGSSGSGGGSSSGTSSDGTSSDSPGGTDADTESSFDLRSSTRGTNASGQINSVLSSYDGKVTRYSETQFSYTKSENDTETGSASSQIIFEREKSENLTVGHFIGFSLSKNSTVGTKSTNIESIGLQVGAYFVDNITDDLFVDGYLAGSLLTNKMEVTTATMTAEADYVSRMLAAGAAVTGSFDVARWEILPTLALDHSTVSSQDASFEVTFGGGNSNELSSPGNVKQLSLTFSPDFRTSFDYYNGYWAQGSTFSLKPKFTCQRINQGTITKECGQGTALSLITQDEDAMKTLSFTLGVDKIAGDTTYSANALYKFEF